MSSVVCGALAGSLTLEGSDVGDRGVCWAGLGWAGLGWTGLDLAAGKIWPERISRKEVTSDSRGLAHWRTATLACVGTGGNFVTIFFDVNLNTS